MAQKDTEDKNKQEKNDEKARKRTAFMLVLSIITALCLLGYVGLLVTAYVRARAGDDLYFTYACGATGFVFIVTLFLTVLTLVMLRSIQADANHSNKLASLVSNVAKNALKEVADEVDKKKDEESNEGISDDLKKKGKIVSKGERKKITVQEMFCLEKTFDIHEFRDYTFGSVIGTYLFLTLFFLSLTAFAWALFISLFHSNRQFRFGYVYIAVDFISGFVAPILLFCSITIGMVVSAFYTNERLSLRNVIPKLFNSVSLHNKILVESNPDAGIEPDYPHEISENDKVYEDVKLNVEYQYWKIQNQFKWDLKDKKNVCFSTRKWLEPHYSTWALWVCICIAALFSFAQFIDETVIEELESSECLPRYDCFIALNKFSFSYFPCEPSNNSYADLLEQTNSSNTDNPKYYCFRFKDFGFDSDVILAIGSAYALFLVQIAVFDKIVGNFHTFLHLKLDFVWTVFYIMVTNISGILIFVINLTSDYQHLVYDVLRSWNIFNFVLYHWVVGIFIITYRYQDQYKEIDKIKKEK